MNNIFNSLKKNGRLISTGLNGATSYDVLCSVNGQLSDGMWENSPRMNGYWMFSQIIFDDNYNIYISISKDEFKLGYYKNTHIKNKFFNMTDRAIIKWYANKIMQILKEEFPSKIIRNRNSSIETEYFGYNQKITITDVFNTYDTLLKNLK